MKKSIYFAVIALVLLFVSACQTDNNPSKVTYPVYLPMSVGNYWIYQHYKIDSLGNETVTNLFDSLVITKDTFINGNKYYVFGGVQATPTFSDILRDSLGYIVTQKGEKIFSSINFTDTINSFHYFINILDDNHEDSIEIYSIKLKMQITPQQQIVPAGTFTTLMAHGMVKCYWFYYDNTWNRTATVSIDKNRYFAQNVGIIVDTYRWYNQIQTEKSKYEKRLIRYHVAETGL